MEPDDFLADFKSDIQNFLTKSGMSRSAFGATVLNDPSFCLRLFDRDVEPSLTTMRTVRAFMRRTDK